MSGYTPGPWRVGKFNGVYTSDGRSVLSQCGDFENAANARLAAAAPDFVAACVGSKDHDVSPLSWLSALLTDLRVLGPRADDEDPLATIEALSHCDRLLADLGAALAKAEGR